MKKVFRSNDYMEAQIVFGLLHNEGYDVTSSGNFLIGGVGELPAADMYILRVPEIQFQQANQLVQDYLQGNLVFDFPEPENP